LFVDVSSTNNLLQQGSPSCKVQYEKQSSKSAIALTLRHSGHARW
jgi:hypothetical protein